MPDLEQPPSLDQTPQDPSYQGLRGLGAMPVTPPPPPPSATDSPDPNTLAFLGANPMPIDTPDLVNPEVQNDPMALQVNEGQPNREIPFDKADRPREAIVNRLMNIIETPVMGVEERIAEYKGRRGLGIKVLDKIFPHEEQIRQLAIKAKDGDEAKQRQAMLDLSGIMKSDSQIEGKQGVASINAGARVTVADMARQSKIAELAAKDPVFKAQAENLRASADYTGARMDDLIANFEAKHNKIIAAANKADAQTNAINNRFGDTPLGKRALAIFDAAETIGQPMTDKEALDRANEQELALKAAGRNSPSTTTVIKGNDIKGNPATGVVDKATGKITFPGNPIVNAETIKQAKAYEDGAGSSRTATANLAEAIRSGNALYFTGLMNLPGMQTLRSVFNARSTEEFGDKIFRTREAFNAARANLSGLGRLNIPEFNKIQETLGFKYDSPETIASISLVQHLLQTAAHQALLSKHGEKNAMSEFLDPKANDKLIETLPSLIRIFATNLKKSKGTNQIAPIPTIEEWVALTKQKDIGMRALGTSSSPSKIATPPAMPIQGMTIRKVN